MLVGYSNQHNFKLISQTIKSKKASSYYVIFVLKFSYIKPAHYQAKGSFSDKVDGYRFNFNKYEEDGSSGENTVNNTGHNESNTTETIEVQINAANCGFISSGDNITPRNATGSINLSKNYYSSLIIDPNGGSYEGKSSKYTIGIKTCENQTMIADPVKEGCVFLGWTFSKGKNCKGASFNENTKIFTYCGSGTSSSNPGNDNINILKAEWFKNDSNLVLPDAGGKDWSLMFFAIYAIGGRFLFGTKRSVTKKPERRIINET